LLIGVAVDAVERLRLAQRGSTMRKSDTSEGIGSFIFEDPAAGTRQSMRVFYFRPTLSVQSAPIVIAMHGLDRAAAAFRDVLIEPAKRHGMTVLVPEFDMDAFPDVYTYNYGNVRLAPPCNQVLPRDQWSFGIIDRLFRHVRQDLGSDRITFGMFGNSAGAQFVLRYLALNEAAAVDRAVASNSGLYMLPDLSLDYPAGTGGLDIDGSDLKRYFARRLTILLGEADADAAAFDLPRGAEAMAQGPHRLARGLWHFDHCRQVADHIGQQLAWTLKIAPGAGHVDQAIFDAALEILGEK
jgi:poly(3-hydroxybutyrate) depolymerase